MRNYKYLTQGRTDLEQLPGYSIDGEIDFRDPISGWYLKGSAYWSAGRSFELTRYFIGDDYIVNVQSNDVNDYSLLSASAEISKAFTSLAGKITGIFDYTRYTSSILQNSIVTDYDSDSYSLSAWYFVNSRLQFFIHARNLLDEREYAYSYIGPLEAVRYSYRIRPMNILVGAQIKF